MLKHIVIVGGGAAGFFCAANIDEKKYKVTLLEQNSDVLQKVKISGGGRCNVTHACFDPRELTQFYPRGNKELLSVFSKFQPGDTMDWFESRGVALKIENDNRVFPESNSSQSIINVLITEVEKKKFSIKTQSVVKEILKNDDRYIVTTNNEEISADYIIYTPGSAPKSLKTIQNLGHTIVSPVPSLFTFNIKDALLKDLPGTSFTYAEVEIPDAKLEESGAMLITHWGLSGPAVLKLSAWGARKLAELKYQFKIRVNFIGKAIADAEEEFIQFKEQHPKKTMGQAKMFDVTNRFWNKVLDLSSIHPEKQISQISKKEMSAILHFLCRHEMQVSGKSTFKEEFVTAGGVDLKEVEFKTMESKLLPNFYLAGEVLNIDAVTGGFNFQACWSEAWLIAQNLNSK